MRTFTFLALCLWATPSFAQVYIGGAVGMDTTLVSTFETGGQTRADSGGTTPAVAVRAGIGLGERWGAEIEVAHALAIEQSETSGRDVFSPIFVSGVAPIEPTLVFTQTLHIDSEQQVTSVNALAWVSYPIGGRVDVVLVAGAAFNRTEVEQRLRFEPVVPPGFPPRPVLIDFEPQATRFISYGVGPLVGVETRMAFGSHLRVVPGFRMSSIGVGWSLRPTVGVAWMF